jgi:hypothetical protein
MRRRIGTQQTRCAFFNLALATLTTQPMKSMFSVYLILNTTIFIS